MEEGSVESRVASIRSLEERDVSSWQAALVEAVKRETTGLKDHVMLLQEEFRKDSHFIRGDATWRKQLETLYERLNGHLETGVDQLHACFRKMVGGLLTQIAEKAQVDRRMWRAEVERQAHAAEEKLRRTRTRCDKETERVRMLERCLRREELHQAKVMHQVQVSTMQQEHAAKVKELHGLLCDLKASYMTLEMINGNLMETLTNQRKEIADLKKQVHLKRVPSIQSIPSTDLGLRRREVVTSTRVETPVSRPMNTEPMVLALKQALREAQQQKQSIKLDLDVANNAKEELTQKLREAKTLAGDAKRELGRVTQLLNESREALVTSQETMATLEKERERLERAVAAVQGRLESACLQLENAKQRLAVNAEMAKALERKTRWCNRLEKGRKDLECVLSEVNDSKRDVTVLDKVHALESAVERIVLLEDVKEERELDREKEEVELRIRNDLLTKFEEQLQFRQMHERKYVLATFDRLWGEQSNDDVVKEDESNQQKTFLSWQKIKVSNTSELAYSVVRQVIVNAFDEIGFEMWDTTDVDALKAQVRRLQDAVDIRDECIDELKKVCANGQEGKTPLLGQQDRTNYFLGPTFDRYRLLQSCKEGLWMDDLSEASRSGRSRELKVYGHVHPLEPRPGHLRPVSANAACLSPIDRPDLPTKPTTAVGGRRGNQQGDTKCDDKLGALSSNLEAMPEVESQSKVDMVQIGSDGVLQMAQRQRRRRRRPKVDGK